MQGRNTDKNNALEIHSIAWQYSYIHMEIKTCASQSEQAFSAC